MRATRLLTSAGNSHHATVVCKHRDDRSPLCLPQVASVGIPTELRIRNARDRLPMGVSSDIGSVRLCPRQ
jgi:hypothetical protein